ncbi:energy-coupling factor transporter transmembrane protein EcfT [Anoxybacillus ayderensis]|uniref:energy-coupling factor transporter transmembrane component T family protein n=1 Tax=Anoxybacillus sp. ST70 TaxID=2864180 RepID=UPI0003067D9F|nr:energy-coupling factor transporter transmembrane protein EcfT [Anoxybacillus sp. ST70]AXM88754.1 energy-coupling factor transporter transmembrane protein EcfT [Anoxybacillus ayderensis G10]MBW9219540.1 energy-coupling factor transporter transmembrane protein EcfT [Anoxybacillus sp. ST70]THD15540.1 energy-coupling factor transporter transmembrane protein EcfT [Anoxybacillus ayderensis]
MMNGMIIGKYVPGHSFIHRLDPRTKLLLMFIYVFIVFLANNGWTYGILTLFTCLLLFLSRIPFSFMIRGLKPVLWVIVFTFFLHVLLTKEGNIVFQWLGMEVYDKAIQQGAFISLRFLLLIVVTTLLTLTTTPIEVTDGMESLLAPLKKWNVPVHELALMMSISLRFIPTLMEETEKIMKAQTARGVDFSSGPLQERMKAMTALLVPLFISAFKRAEELAVAMEVRGYRGGQNRTKWRELTWGRIDTAFMIFIGLLAIVLWLLRS